MAATQTPMDALRASRLAQDLKPEQLEKLAEVVRLESFAAKQVLAREGGIDNRLYAIVEGELSVLKHMGTPDENLLASLHAGDFAHELGFIDGTPHFASLVAARDSRVLLLEREQLDALVEREPRLVFGLMCSIVRAVHGLQSRLSMQASELTNYVVKQHGRY